MGVAVVNCWPESEADVENNKLVVVELYHTVLHLTSHPGTGLTGCEGQLELAGKHRVM